MAVNALSTLRPADYAAGMQGFTQGNALAMAQSQDARAAEKQKAELLQQNLSLIGSIALGAKGGRLDGQVDPQRFEQGLNYLASRGVNVDQFRGRPEMADVAASASLTGMQQLQAGMMSQQVQQQFLQNMLAVRRDARDEARSVRDERRAVAADARAGLPEGYERGPDGAARRIEGLPPAGQVATPQSSIGKLNADLAAGRITREQFDVEQERITKQAETPLAQNVITSLNSAGKNLEDLDRFARTFDPNFAGYRMNALGEAANSLGARGVGTENMQRGSAWWADYARFRNTIRNELFGSALTATEQRAFEQADITPGMAPEQIRQNLQRQQEAAQSAARKLAAPHVAAGRSVEQIEGALGRGIDALGITRPERRRAPAPPASPGTTAAPAPASTGAASGASPRSPGTVIGPAPEGAQDGRTGRLPDGTRVRVQNGQLVVAE